MAAHLHAETRFVELMTALFQLDEAEALDFGVYRIIRRQNQEVQAFLGKIERNRYGEKHLHGGRLSQLLDDEFKKLDSETGAQDEDRIKDLEAAFGLKPGMGKEQRQALLTSLEAIPAMANQVAEYRKLLDVRANSNHAATDRAEVLNRLYQFFSRHYQDGDFIVERRYGRDGSRYIRSTGEDTEFHWATEDMYYIKSGDIFTDYPVRLTHGQAIVFSVEASALNETRAALKPTDKAHYELHRIVKQADGSWLVNLKYLKGTQTEKQKNDIAEAIHAKCGGDLADIKRWLNRYIARNQSDFFIHKRLRDTLSQDLGIFLKTEVLNTDQLLSGQALASRQINVARVVQQVGLQIIDFLAALEDFQKRLWEKRKLVFNTRYVITLDRIAQLAGADWLEGQLPTIIRQCRGEWEALGLGKFSQADDCRHHKTGDLVTADSVHYLPLPVDTQHFDEMFKWALLEAVSREHDLDDSIDGVAIHSDNWQALNTLVPKYRDQVKCVYIDPPYNTNASGIPYKNGYRHASWGALMHNRLEKLHQCMSNDSAIFVSIDKVERTLLEHTLDSIYGSANKIEELIWVQNTNDGKSPTYSTNHEYVEVYAKQRYFVEQDRAMFREPKPGYAEVMELVDALNPDYPPIAVIEQQLKALYKQHQAELREDCEQKDLDWEEEKRNDPWKGLYPYSHAEYRDTNGKHVPKHEARNKQAHIWIWRESDWTIMSSETKQSESIRDPNNPNYRYYEPIHPVTGKPCTLSSRGWKGTQFIDSENPERNSFESLVNDYRMAFGEDENKVPQQKRFLHEVETNVSKSIFTDFSDGEKQTTAMFGKSGLFLAPKHTNFVSRFVIQGSNASSYVLDCFGGSGSTAHAVMEVNRVEKSRRKFITAEVNRYFDTLIVPRLKKAASASHWQNGKAKELNGRGVFMRVQTLEQYEDTLDNLEMDSAQGQSGSLEFEDKAWNLSYRLDRLSRETYCSIEKFRSPFGYKLKQAVGGGVAQARPVDVVESLIYLLGLHVTRLYREPQGVVMMGRNTRSQQIAVFFRDCGQDNTAQWVQDKQAQHPADVVYTNDPAALSFPGSDQLASIEGVFAGQFGSLQ